LFILYFFLFILTIGFVYEWKKGILYLNFKQLLKIYWIIKNYFFKRCYQNTPKDTLII
jgi:hypothetical protein